MAASVLPETKSINGQAGSAKESRPHFVILIGIITFALLGIGTVFLISYSANHPAKQTIILTGVQAAAWVIAGITLFRAINLSVRVFLLITAILIMLAGFSILVSEQAILSALAALAYTVVITSVSASGTSAERGLALGGIGAWAISLAGLASPFEKATIPEINIFNIVFLGILVLVYVALLALHYAVLTLRLRMIIGSMLLVIIPLLVVSLIQATIVQNSVSDRIRETLLSAAGQTAFRVDELLESNRELISSDASLPALSKYLSLPPEKRQGSTEEANLWVTFEALKKRPQPHLVSYGLLDYLGLVLYDINPEEIGQYEADTGSYSDALRGRQYISNIEFSVKDGKPYLYFASPVYDENKVVRGIIRVKYDANILQSILSENTNIVGNNAFPILVDENMLRLADTRNPQDQYKLLAPPTETTIMVLKSMHRIPQNGDSEPATGLTELSSALSGDTEHNFISANFNPRSTTDADQNFVAVARTKNKPWILLYTQPASVLSDLLKEQQKSATLITTLLAGIAALFTTIFAWALTRPVLNLTETARQISQGDLTATAVVSNDEIGMLANAFNIMTGQLKKFITELEDRVRLRTSELSEINAALTIRSRQIQTISEVAQKIAASQGMESLLDQVTDLVSSRFNFYHAGIFLVDENRDYAVLRASNSEGGKRMLARRHMLRIGQVGIVGHVCENGEARIASDVGVDTVYFNNPDLPDTRSEMALPLIGAGQIIGALDVQSTHENAFTQEDIELFSALADQVAIAVLNSRAFEETQRALSEAQQVHRQYLQREWNRELTEKDHLAYEFTPQGLVAQDHVDSEVINAVFTTGKMHLRNSTQNNTDQERAVLGMPIKLRGETIGIIHLQDESAAAREWANEEIQIVQTIADQVAQALENARLFQQTLRRADRERKVIEISSKIRSTNDPELMMKIAVEELQHALHASKTQVILSKNLGKPESVNEILTGSDQPLGSNGNGKSGPA